MSSAGVATIVYVGNSDSQDIAVLLLQANGEIAPVEMVPVPGPAKPGGSLPLAVSPNKKFLYAGLRNEPYSVVTFAIAPSTGRLTHVGTGPLADSMAYIATDRSGRFLLGASYAGSKVTINPIGADGIVAPSQQTVASLPNAHCILPDAANHYVLYTALGGDVIHQAKFDAKIGKLTPNDPPTVSVKEKAGPRHLIFSPNQEFVYLVNELDASIYVFPYDSASGTLKKESQVVSALPTGLAGKPSAADIHVTPNGKFLYASERASSTLAAFRVDHEKGTLTPIDCFATETQPRGFAIDPSGRYLLAVGQLSNRMTSYAIDRSNGRLSKLNEYPMGRNPNWVEIVRLP